MFLQFLLQNGLGILFLCDISGDLYAHQKNEYMVFTRQQFIQNNLFPKLLTTMLCLILDAKSLITCAEFPKCSPSNPIQKLLREKNSQSMINHEHLGTNI